VAIEEAIIVLILVLFLVIPTLVVKVMHKEKRRK